MLATVMKELWFNGWCYVSLLVPVYFSTTYREIDGDLTRAQWVQWHDRILWAKYTDLE